MKVRKPAGGADGNSRSRHPPAYDMAKNAVIEKRLSGYIALVCGHYTSWDIDEMYSCWRPAKGKFYCENCGKWVVRAPLHKPKPVRDDDPLF